MSNINSYVKSLDKSIKTSKKTSITATGGLSKVGGWTRYLAVWIGLTAHKGGIEIDRNFDSANSGREQSREFWTKSIKSIVKENKSIAKDLKKTKKKSLKKSLARQISTNKLAIKTYEALISKG